MRMRAACRRPTIYSNACHPYPDALEALATLRGLRFWVGAISDAPPSMRAALARHGFLALVDHVTLSSEVGRVKPAQEIFHAALQAAGVEAAEAIFVDDTPANVDGAYALGFAQAYVIDRDRPRAPGPAPQPDRPASASGAACARRAGARGPEPALEGQQGA
jgi:FMN phosphatase YigB (HAD superfamily)